MPVKRSAVIAVVVLLSWPALAGAQGDIPQEGGNLTPFVEGSTADLWGARSEDRASALGGDPEEVRITLPPDLGEPVKISDDVVTTRILANLFGGGSIPLKGRVGDDPLFPDRYPSYRRGWRAGEGGGVQIGFDAGMVGFFVEFGYQVFQSKGQTYVGSGAWFRYTDIRISTLCPGFKIQFPDWVLALYHGDTPWQVSWYDFLLHSFPYLKFGVGPTWIRALEAGSDTAPMREYWETGLSYTFFLCAGLEWRPFHRWFSCFFEIGLQAFVFTTETAYSRSPDWLTAMPVRVGLSANF